jgi:hypothetical protein
MKVQDLIENLKILNPEAEILMSQDGEGNGFSFLDGIGTGLVSKSDLHRSNIDNYLTEDNAEPEDFENAVPIVCFWPMN